MPGIAGHCSAEADPKASDAKLDRMVSSILHQPWYKVAVARGKAGSFACVHHGYFDHALVASSADGEVGVVLDGWLFGRPFDERQKLKEGALSDAAQHCLRLYTEQGIDFVRRMNGQFNLLVWDDRRREIFLINDRYGLRPWQYALLEGTLYFAPEGKAILAGSGAAPRLNCRMAVNQLSWGRIWIGQETLFEDILMLPPASILRWKDGRVKLDQYWDYRYEPELEIDDGFIEHAVATFRDAVARQTRAGLRYGISLSGGLDSRAVLAAVSPQQVGDFQTYSWGFSETSDEVTIARETAAQLGVPWQYLPLCPSDFISQAGRGVFLSEGLDLSVQSYGLKVYPAVREHTDALLTGLALDLTLGGTYLSPALIGNGASADSALSWVLDQSTLFTPEECRRLMRLKQTATLLEELRERAFGEWQAGQNSDPADQCDRFFLRTRVWRYTFARQAWQRLFVEDLAPTFDNEFVDCILHLPPAWRVGHRFYQRFLQALDPRMMNITYQRTLLPPSSPLEFWPVGARLEEQKEQLYRDIWRATKGKAFIPYKRFSTNYDEWLRCDADWIAVTDDLLLSRHSLICNSLLERQAVADLVATHRSGTNSQHKKIIQLMTLELFLRQFFK